MRVIAVLALAMTAALTAGALAQTSAPTNVAGTADWTVDGPARAAHARIAPYLGREALWLRAGTHVTRTGSNMADGTIEFDLAPMKTGDFAAITFRRQSATNHENIYFRLSRSGEFMAVQYAPRINGSSTWQLYPEFTAATAWPREQWTHVRVEVAGAKLRVFVGDGAMPVLSVDRLRHDSGAGEVALWARVNNQPDEWAAAYSNFTIKPATQIAPREAAKPPPVGVISSWQVAATSVPAGNAPPPRDLTWTRVVAEESGLVNLNRSFTAQPGKRVTAYARATINSRTATTVRLGIGYSDDVTVYLNGQPIYAGINGWNSRYPVFVSFVDAKSESVFAPLKAGDNELVFAVTDDQFFGWGLSARIDPALGVTVR